MAYANKKQYENLKGSDSGKELLLRLPTLSQDEFNVEYGKLVGNNVIVENNEPQENSDYKERVTTRISKMLKYYGVTDDNEINDFTNDFFNYKDGVNENAEEDE